MKSSAGPIRQMKTPPWMSSPALGSPPPQDETDSRHNARLYLSEGPVRVLSSHVSLVDINFFLSRLLSYFR